jgi:hypothetical protein
MADFIFGQAAGKFAEWAARVNANDPTNSAFVIMALGTAGTDAVLRDLDTFAAIEADGSTSEQTGGTYVRKTLTDASSITITIDDTNNRTDVDCPDQTWTALTVTSGVITDLVFGYDSDTTAGTDANIVPLSQHDFSVTPDGSDVTATIAVFARATAT